MVIKNSTLDYIVQKGVYYISKHLGGYKVIYVNCNPPSFEKFCNYTELPIVSSKKGTIALITAGIIASGIVIIIVIILYKRYEIILNAFYLNYSVISHSSVHTTQSNLKFTSLGIDYR